MLFLVTFCWRRACWLAFGICLRFSLPSGSFSSLHLCIYIYICMCAVCPPQKKEKKKKKEEQERKSNTAPAGYAREVRPF